MKETYKYLFIGPDEEAGESMNKKKQTVPAACVAPVPVFTDEPPALSSADSMCSKQIPAIRTEHLQSRLMAQPPMPPETVFGEYCEVPFLPLGPNKAGGL